MAGSTGRPRVLARAATSDAIFPNPEDHQLTAAEIAGIRRALHLPPDPLDLSMTVVDAGPPRNGARM